MESGKKHRRVSIGGVSSVGLNIYLYLSEGISRSNSATSVSWGIYDHNGELFPRFGIILITASRYLSVAALSIPLRHGSP